MFSYSKLVNLLFIVFTNFSECSSYCNICYNLYTERFEFMIKNKVIDSGLEND